MLTVSAGPQTLQHHRRLAAIRALHRARRSRTLSRSGREAAYVVQAARQGGQKADVHVATACKSARRVERNGASR